MKNIFKVSVVLFFSLSLVVSSCKKDEVLIEGCTDEAAMNYQSLATSNNGSCWFAHEVLVNTWNISSECDGDLVGGVLPSTIEVSAGENKGDLMIDLGTAGIFNGTISESGIILIPSQSALSVGAISGSGMLESATSVNVNIIINMIIITESCELTLTL